MEYIDGITLKEYMENKGALSDVEALHFIKQILKGLAHAHERGIVHRDIKPHNILLLKNGTIKITDFGIDRLTKFDTQTISDMTIGSVHYISPEQARGGYTDERSDIYSLGVVLYEMITGKVPFDSDRPVTVAIMHLQEKPVMPREHNISIPLALEKIVMKAMSKEISMRYKNASEMIADLTAVLNDPSRVVVEAPEEKTTDEGMDKTIVMPAVKLRDIQTEAEDEVKPDYSEKEPDKEKETEPDTKKKTTEDFQGEIDKKKEKKVIAFAIISAIAVILLISMAFMSITGMNGLFASAGTVEIPEIEGMLYDEAVKQYVDSEDEDAEYKFNIIKGKTVESDEEEGTIISQDPAPGEKVKKEEVIIITVEISEGNNEIKLKNYTKFQDSRAVEIEIKSLGLEADFVEEYSNDIPKGSIIKQEPSSGSYVKKGDVITFYVSKGPDTKEDEKDNASANNGGDKTAEGNKGDNKEPNSETQAPKKSTMLTIYGPRNKDNALVQVNVNGRNVYSKNLKKDQSDVVKLEGTSNSVEVEILHDGVSQQRGTVTLH